MSQQDPSSTPHNDGPRHERPIEETPTEARQASRGLPMLWVMGISTVAAAVILLLVVVFSGVYAPTPNTGLTPQPKGPFEHQVHKEKQPGGTKTTPAQPAQ